MSVLIKGMTRPKNCFECHLTKWIDDGCAGCWADDKIHNASRPDDCPLVEIPKPHGRLIDADRATAESIKMTGKRLLAIDTAPTIIEAEWSEDDERFD